ncbi:MAG: hypothetical protein QXY39_06010 [Thermofilaceae archaeon]
MRIGDCFLFWQGGLYCRDPVRVGEAFGELGLGLRVEAGEVRDWRVLVAGLVAKVVEGREEVDAVGVASQVLGELLIYPFGLDGEIKASEVPFEVGVVVRALGGGRNAVLWGWAWWVARRMLEAKGMRGDGGGVGLESCAQLG